MDVTVSGKRVTLRGRLPARANWDLLTRYGQGLELQEMAFDDVVDLLRRVIEAWEFDGDPAEVESYSELDLFGEFMPLVVAVSQQLSAIVSGEKN